MARELGVNVTASELIGISAPSSSRFQHAAPIRICHALDEPVRGSSGKASDGLGGLVAKLPGMNKKALLCVIESDLARLDDTDRGLVLSRLAENLDLLDAIDPSQRSSAPIRKRVSRAVFGRVKFKDLGKRPGGSAPLA